MTSISNFADYDSSSQVFEATAAWQRPTSMTLKSADGAEEIRASVVTAGFFSVLGVEPALGRTFGAEERAPGGSRTVVLSHGLWHRRFGASAEALEATLVLDGSPYTIIGVAPRDFESPAGESEIFVPMEFTPNAIDRGQNYLSAIARLKPAIRIEEAQAEMELVGARLEREYPATNDGVRPRLVRLSDQVLGPVRPVLLALFGGVLFLLAVACANVSNLQLARIVARERENAIRLSLGASRVRVFVSTLFESFGIWSGGAAGAFLGILFGSPLLSALIDDRLPRPLPGTADARTLGFTALVAAATALVFGVPTALYACRAPLESALRAARAPLTEDPDGSPPPSSAGGRADRSRVCTPGRKRTPGEKPGLFESRPPRLRRREGRRRSHRPRRRVCRAGSSNSLRRGASRAVPGAAFGHLRGRFDRHADECLRNRFRRALPRCRTNRSPSAPRHRRRAFVPPHPSTFGHSPHPSSSAAISRRTTAPTRHGWSSSIARSPEGSDAKRAPSGRAFDSSGRTGRPMRSWASSRIHARTGRRTIRSRSFSSPMPRTPISS